MVAMHQLVGDQLQPHLASLNGSKLKLLNLVIYFCFGILQVILHMSAKAIRVDTKSCTYIGIYARMVSL